ncbi:hypothetical protein GCM10011515_22030 [Tsuneonella deserti]|uniref:Tip attachment protein J domain-containing protein n=1 Tax=Tsuneonella deserti TaxID=2035528 RepID=A0ABQ1S9T1_9SPHN|nr:phage tail protein [Tsuneonella deserti]GGE01957.1 hypothetical protein GCM10011515_22030 [Tsuneonella deserti]
MATLLLTAVGTMIGGPLGGAIGAFAGRSLDAQIIGGGKREGPRLRDLAVTTSSYGQPIPRHHGRMRAAGTVIWATDLVEHKDRSGGSKGQPSVTSYAYTTSFAVALSSRPIRGVGRIWADGNLLRGAAGDMKAGGVLRVHTGHGDQSPDPLVAAAEGASCPAFRDCAYVVFEDLALENFGNRVPALTFEIIADDGAIALADLVGPTGADGATPADLGPLAGFANEGGPLGGTIEVIGTLFPLSVTTGEEGLVIRPAEDPGGTAALLPPPARGWEENDFGANGGGREDRDAGKRERIAALRYYDVARDFQAGVQRSRSRAEGRGQTIEFPGALSADDARSLTESADRRSGWRRDALQWRVAELDPLLGPGSHVRVPGKPGTWIIQAWEWRERGVELELVRRSPAGMLTAPGDPGASQPPADLMLGPTVLRAFELPAADTTEGLATSFAAAAGRGHWNGAALFLDRAGELVPIGHTGRTPATIGRLAASLAPSAAMLFEPTACIDIELPDGGSLPTVGLSSLLMGANRLLVGGEVLQFARVQQLGPTTWRLTGLLRGRGGTEAAALAGHAAGADAILIDDSIVGLNPALVPGEAASTIAAIGVGDSEPVYAGLANPGLSRAPLSPVHPRWQPRSDGGLEVGWVRRARGAWTWRDGVEVPLVEETEAYRVGVGTGDAPAMEWQTGSPQLLIDRATRSALLADHDGEPLWVRQIGRFAQSPPLFLGLLA